jgi:hypothetical protein
LVKSGIEFFIDESAITVVIWCNKINACSIFVIDRFVGAWKENVIVFIDVYINRLFKL